MGYLELIGSFVAPETGGYTFHLWSEAYARSQGYASKTRFLVDGERQGASPGTWSMSSIMLTKDFRYAIQEKTDASFHYCSISLGFNSPNYGEDPISATFLKICYGGEQAQLAPR
jgi:hypothetical protein